MMIGIVPVALAFAANFDGRHERTTHLLGASARMREFVGGSTPPIGMGFFGDPEADARAALGDEEYERRWAEGYAMTTDEAVAYALEYIE